MIKAGTAPSTKSAHALAVRESIISLHKNGSGTPGHIRIPEAEQMSDELAAYISSLGDEIWED